MKNTIREYPQEIKDFLAETHENGTTGKHIQSAVRKEIREAEKNWNLSPHHSIAMLGLAEFEAEQIHDQLKKLYKFYTELKDKTDAEAASAQATSEVD